MEPSELNEHKCNKKADFTKINLITSVDGQHIASFFCVEVVTCLDLEYLVFQVIRQEYISSASEGNKDAPLFKPSQPREKWLKRRTTIKLRVSSSMSGLFMFSCDLHVKYTFF